MSALTAPLWLGRAYAAALIIHAGIVVACVGLAIVAVKSLGYGANAAREGFVVSTAVFATYMLAAVPSTLALLSWWLCRRRDWRPSFGHMGLTIAAASALFIFIAVEFFS